MFFVFSIDIYVSFFDVTVMNTSNNSRCEYCTCLFQSNYAGIHCPKYINRNDNSGLIRKVQQKNIYAIDVKTVRLNGEYGTRITIFFFGK